MMRWTAQSGQAGSSTAEYAAGVTGAVGFALMLLTMRHWYLQFLKDGLQFIRDCVDHLH
jgi:hypothetical protein